METLGEDYWNNRLTYYWYVCTNINTRASILLDGLFKSVEDEIVPVLFFSLQAENPEFKWFNVEHNYLVFIRTGLKQIVKELEELYEEISKYFGSNYCKGIEENLLEEIKKYTNYLKVF